MNTEKTFPSNAHCSVCSTKLTEDTAHELFSLESGFCKTCQAQMEKDQARENVMATLDAKIQLAKSRIAYTSDAPIFKMRNPKKAQHGFAQTYLCELQADLQWLEDLKKHLTEG